MPSEDDNADPEPLKRSRQAVGRCTTHRQGKPVEENMLGWGHIVDQLGGHNCI